MINLGVPGDFRRQRIGWNNRDGDYGEVEYEGNQAFIQTQHASLRNGNNVLDVEIWNQGAKWMLRARLGIGAPNQAEQATQIDLRLSVNRVHKSILEAPYTRDTITREDIEKIRRAQTWALAASPALTNPDAQRLYVFTLLGVESRIVYQPVLHVIKSAPARHAWPDAGASVGRVFTSGGLIEDAQIGGRINFTMPSSGVETWESISYRRGWLKHEPWFDTAAGGRSTAVLEYEFGLWPEFLYPPI